MKPDPRWIIPPDMLARIARYKARKPRPVQRAEYRARMLERAQENYRRANAPFADGGALADSGGNNGGNNGRGADRRNGQTDPGAGGSPPYPPAGVS